MSFQVGLASTSFQNLIQTGELNIFGYLEMIHYRYRVTCTDISTILLTPEMLEPDCLWKIRDVLDEHRISLSCLCIDGPVLWSEDPEKRQHDHQVILSCLEAARRLGARSVSLDWGGEKNSCLMSEEALEHVTINMMEYCKFCSDYGMKAGPENKPGYAMNSMNLMEVKNAVNHPAYGHLLRVGSWQPGNGRDMLAVCLPILMHTHFPAESVIWSKDLIRRIARTNYQGAYCVEQNCGIHEMARAEWHLSVLRGLTAELQYEGLEPLTPGGYYCQIAKIDPPDGILDI